MNHDVCLRAEEGKEASHPEQWKEQEKVDQSDLGDSGPDARESIVERGSLRRWIQNSEI